MINVDRKLAALSMDLKRVALGYHRNSLPTATRFTTESLQKVKSIDSSQVPTYVKKILNNLEAVLKQTDKERLAEDALMYSTLLQNAVLHKTA